MSAVRKYFQSIDLTKRWLCRSGNVAVRIVEPSNQLPLHSLIFCSVLSLSGSFVPSPGRLYWRARTGRGNSGIEHRDIRLPAIASRVSKVSFCWQLSPCSLTITTAGIRQPL